MENMNVFPCDGSIICTNSLNFSRCHFTNCGRSCQMCLEEADTVGEGASFSGKRTRSLQAAPWAQFSLRFLRLKNLGHIPKDTNVLLPCLCAPRTLTVQTNGAAGHFSLGNCMRVFVWWVLRCCVSRRVQHPQPDACSASMFPDFLTNAETIQSLINSSVINP